MFRCLLSCLAVGGSARLYSGLCSCTCCSVISLPCCWYICMYKFSQLFMRWPFLQGCINLSVSCAVPYSCPLFNICVAYAEVLLLVLMYRICSLYLVISLSDCPTYFCLHVLHVISYIPLGLLLCFLFVNCWYMVLVVLNAICFCVFLNRFVTLRINGL